MSRRDRPREASRLATRPVQCARRRGERAPRRKRLAGRAREGELRAASPLLRASRGTSEGDTCKGPHATPTLRCELTKMII